MSIDQAMVQRAAVEPCLLLRTYGWSEPTLSLGYFQSHADRLTHPASRACSWVRRGTGGGAILHDHDWTYSIAVPQRWLAAEQTRRGASIGAAHGLYAAVHDAIVDWLRQCGWAARQWSEPAGCRGDAKSRSCRFLCFERRSAGDVVVGEVKVMGSAQRRHRGVVLQHGSLLLRRSQFAPSLAGIEDLPNKCPPGSRAAEFRVENLGAAVRSGVLNALAKPHRLAAWEQHANLESFLPASDSEDPGKFGTPSWNRKR